MISPYQKITKDGKLIQPGNMDTPVKFEQLTQGIDLKGKRVLDVGCNLGAMCNIATEKGAITFGVDIEGDYIRQAKKMFPNLNFQCLAAESIYGNCDIIIASAMLHYVTDLDTVFKVFARCSKQVLCDIWLNDAVKPIYTLTHRNIFIPSESAFRNIVGKYFNTIEKKGSALTPDQSKRYIFHLSDPKPDPPEAVLIYGKADTGKTTLAKEFLGYELLMTDHLFHAWRTVNRSSMLSVRFFSELARGDKKEEYYDFFIRLLGEQLTPYVNRDIVIEGYELQFDGFRQRVIDLLSGWKVAEIHRTQVFEHIKGWPYK